MSSSASQPSPVLFFNTVNAHQRTAAIRTAVELDVFSAIAQGNLTAAALAQHCGTAERGIRILCDYLVVLGFLTKTDQEYGLTEDSAIFLDRNSPAYAGNAIQFLLSPTLIEGFQNLTAAVRQGGTAIPETGTLAPDHPVWVKFAEAMAPMMAMPAQQIARQVLADTTQSVKVLDIAASHGLFGLAFAEQNPQAAVVAVDWPAVLEVAERNAQKLGVRDRFHTIAGSAFEVDLGQDYDVALLPNFLHHFDPPTCVQLLQKIHTALKPGGQVVTFEFIPNDDRVSPPDAAVFSLVMLATTPAGDAYTLSEYEQMFAQAGFANHQLVTLPTAMQQVLISCKAQ